MIELLSGEIAYVYEARNDDDKVIGYFHTKEEADEAVGQQSGTVKSVQVLKQNIDLSPVLGKNYDNRRANYYLINKIDLEDKETIKRRALSKLTLAERKVLGLE